MKKLKKSSLEELAKKMPLVSEREKSFCIGGHYFYNEETGDFLGTYGAGDEIRIARKNNFDWWVSTNPQGNYVEYSNFLSTSILSDTLKTKVLTHIVKKNSIYGNRIGVVELSTRISNCGVLLDSGAFYALSGNETYTPSVSGDITRFVMNPSSATMDYTSTLGDALRTIFNKMGVSDPGISGDLSGVINLPYRDPQP